MSDNGVNVENLVRAGKMSLNELKETFASASNSLVTIDDWNVCYSSITGELSEYATVISNNSDNPITGIGMSAYSQDGSKTYALQYTNNFSSAMISTSVGTTLYTPSDGNEVICVIYGWTEQGGFFFNQTMGIIPCTV